MKLPALLMSLALLAGCASGPRMDTSHPSANQDSRVQFVVLHYTSTSLERSLQLLTSGPVSSHYLIGDTPPTIYKLVDENQRAWHAGESQWKGRTWLNSSSIGIEIVNPGFKDTPTGRLWYPYSEAQVQSLIVLLKDISKRHAISPRSIIGHSDIAPQRKVDPGPLFPWWRLADAGLIRWPDAAQVVSRRGEFERALPDALWFQQQLAKVGFSLAFSGQFDEQTRNVLAAFQMKYRPARYDGLADAETAAILAVLNNIP